MSSGGFLGELRLSSCVGEVGSGVMPLIKGTVQRVAEGRHYTPPVKYVKPRYSQIQPKQSPPLVVVAWVGFCVDLRQSHLVWNAPDRTDNFHLRGRYHGGRRPPNDDSFHSPTVIAPSALDKPSIMKRYHSRRTCRHTSPRSPTMLTLHNTRFVECWWWNDGWTVKTVCHWR